MLSEEKAIQAVKEDRTSGVRVTFYHPKSCGTFFKQALTSKILSSVEAQGSAITDDAAPNIVSLLAHSTVLTYLALREARLEQKSLQGIFRAVKHIYESPIQLITSKSSLRGGAKE